MTPYDDSVFFWKYGHTKWRAAYVPGETHTDGEGTGASAAEGEAEA